MESTRNRARITTLLGAGAALVALGGCVAPQPVKDASALHTQNLEALRVASAEHKERIAAYYAGLVDLQRRAFVAAKAGAEIDRTVQDAGQISVGTSNRDAASRNFIDRSLALTDVMRLAASEFDRRLNLSVQDQDAQSDSNDQLTSRISADEAEFAALLERPNSRTDPDNIAARRKLRSQIGANTYLLNARRLVALSQRAGAGLDVLNAQLKVMQAAHGIIDAHISTNATIDAAAIATALKKGAEADPAGLTEVARAFGAAPRTRGAE